MTGVQTCALPISPEVSIGLPVYLEHLPRPGRVSVRWEGSGEEETGVAEEETFLAGPCLDEAKAKAGLVGWSALEGTAGPGAQMDSRSPGLVIVIPLRFSLSSPSRL